MRDITGERLALVSLSDMGFVQRKGARAQRRKQMKEKPAAAKPPPSLRLRVSAALR
jgi:hypothetical protein